MLSSIHGSKVSAPLCIRRAPCFLPHRPVRLNRATGADSTGWLDLTRLVTGGGGTKSPYDELATEIGKQVYLDIGGWHLYTRDLSATPASKMNVALAMSLGPKAAQNGGRLSEQEVVALLKTIPVKVSRPPSLS